jgi:hypothetical protein
MCLKKQFPDLSGTFTLQTKKLCKEYYFNNICMYETKKTCNINVPQSFQNETNWGITLHISMRQSLLTPQYTWTQHLAPTI